MANPRRVRRHGWVHDSRGCAFYGSSERQNDRIFDLERAVWVLKARSGFDDDFDDFGTFDIEAFNTWRWGRKVVRGRRDEKDFQAYAARIGVSATAGQEKRKPG